MREFPNPVIYGRGGRTCTMPAIWESDGGRNSPSLPVTPRRLILLGCHGGKDGRPGELSFSRTNKTVLDQIEPQERRVSDNLFIDTEQLQFIRPWVNKQVAIAWPVDAPDLIDAFDEIIDKQELKAEAPERSDNSDNANGREEEIAKLADLAQKAESPS